MNIKHIFEGWANVVKERFDALDPAIQEEAKLRLESCNNCYMRANNKCDPKKVGENLDTGILTKGCGCNLSAKVLSPCTKCPLAKWSKMKICDEL